MKVSPKQLAQWIVNEAQDASNARLHDLATVFVDWLRARGELKRLPEILRAIDRVWQNRYGVANVTIETAFPLSKTLSHTLQKITAGSEMREIVDPSLIGGARVRIDEYVIDGSIAGMLHQLKQTFSS